MPNSGIKSSFQTGVGVVGEVVQSLLANPMYYHFCLLDLLHGCCRRPHARTHTQIIVEFPAHLPEFPMPPFLNEKAGEPRDKNRVRERVSVLTLYWKLLLYGVPCIRTCLTRWEEAPTTFLVTLQQELTLFPLPYLHHFGSRQWLQPQ